MKLLLGLVFMVLGNLVHASSIFSDLHCSTMLYVGNVKIKVDFENKKYVLLQESTDHLPDVVYDLVSKGEIVNVSIIEGGLVQLIEFESDHGELGSITVFTETILGLPANFKRAVLTNDGVKFKMNLMCF